MTRRWQRLGATVLGLVTVGALLASCRTAVVQGACTSTLVASTPGTLQDSALTEASGISVSAKNPGTLWVHNDSGDSARLFAISETGATRAIYTLSGATAIDWEDMALGRGPVAGTPYLYAGDIGDNAEARPTIVVYRVPEPVVVDGARTALTGVDKLTLTYPDGAKNAEALLLDPRTGELFVIQKSLTGGAVGVYRAPANLATGSTTVMTKVGTLTLPSGLASSVTAADISPDGSSVAIRTYGGVHLWTRLGNQTLVDAISAAECTGPVPSELQGEAVGFRADSQGYYTVSEGASAALHRFDAPPPTTTTTTLTPAP